MLQLVVKDGLEQAGQTNYVIAKVMNLVFRMCAGQLQLLISSMDAQSYRLQISQMEQSAEDASLCAQSPTVCLEQLGLFRKTYGL